MSKTLLAILVVLGLPKPVAALIIRLNVILEAMTANKVTFPSPPIALSTVSAHVAALSAAESATKTHAPGTKQTRDDARTLVIADARQLHAYVQQLANASPDKAGNIAADAAMTLRKHGTHPIGDLTVKQTLSGTMHVSARSVKGARAHEWQHSSDGGKTWNNLPPTTQSRTTIGNLQPGTLMQFRHRVITKAGPGDWTAPVSFAVS